VITAVDTNVLLDVLVPNAPSRAASLKALDVAAAGGLVLADAVYAELAAWFPDRASLDRFLSDTAIRLAPSSTGVLHAAGVAWRRYTQRRVPAVTCPACGASQTVVCQRCGRELSPRQHVLADFLIGAHALENADQLLTRDRGYYATYFPRLRLA
jgi:predicted nucleic acid-binding protein